MGIETGFLPSDTPPDGSSLYEFGPPPQPEGLGFEFGPASGVSENELVEQSPYETALAGAESAGYVSPSLIAMWLGVDDATAASIFARMERDRYLGPEELGVSEYGMPDWRTFVPLDEE
jgi:hypothetical protein